MIFDVCDAFLLVSGLILAVFFFVDYVVGHKSQLECDHRHMANYQSRGERQCIDCGYTEKTDKHYPNHQR